MINPNPVQTNQDFSTVEKLFLPGRPLSCQVTGTFIFAEPAGPDSVVVFGDISWSSAASGKPAGLPRFMKP